MLTNDIHCMLNPPLIIILTTAYVSFFFFPCSLCPLPVLCPPL